MKKSLIPIAAVALVAAGCSHTRPEPAAENAARIDTALAGVWWRVAARIVARGFMSVTGEAEPKARSLEAIRADGAHAAELEGAIVREMRRW